MNVTLAILYIPNKETAMKEVAGVSLISRALVCALRADINKIYLLGIENSEHQKQIEQMLKRDPRVTNNCWQWINSPEQIETTQTTICYRVDALFRPATFDRFVKQNHNATKVQEGNVFLKFAYNEQQCIPRTWSTFIKYTVLTHTITNEVHIVNSTRIKEAENHMLNSLQAPWEGKVDTYFNRPVGRLITMKLARAKCSPNLASSIAIILGIIAALLVVNGYYWQTILAVLLLQISAVIDCIDGDLARLQFRESILGKWLDIAGDNFVHVVFFICLAIREYSIVPTTVVVYLGISLAVTTTLSFFLVVYYQNKLKPQITGSNKMHNFIDGLISRDFTILLLIGSIFGNLHWFLWLAAIGGQLFLFLLVLIVLDASLTYLKSPIVIEEQ
ncbi:CDP-alcohol phosphatidyltransferase family protein [Candidatus Uabimicrobium sp. HlEnr_7]|uniref:CDP-alcohol phosphatidyltransferase family protein n=1 Tax=Candidatus Uabimicrobium helgolandensis TaxID=3095367 RepID=UPI003558D8B0